MKAVFIIILLVGGGWVAYNYYKTGSLGLGSGSSNVTMGEDHVVIVAGDIEAEFRTLQSLRETIMLFGGTYTSHKNAVAPIALSGLYTLDAQPIYANFPDFHMCKSPGAPQAKALVRTLSIIPSDSQILKTLKKGLDDFKANLKADGERVCLNLEGSKLEMQSAQVVEHGVDVMPQLRSQEYYLITAANRIDCQEALTASK